MRRVLAAWLTAVTMTGTAYGCDSVLPDHLRVLDCRLAKAMTEAAGRSALLHDLIDRVERTDGLVYVTPLPSQGAAKGLLGGFSHDVTVAGPYRVVRILLPGKYDDEAMAIAGHELRHALEVLETANVRCEADVEALYDRIGWRTSGRTVETQAAMDAGNEIARELHASKPNAPSPHDKFAAQTDVLR